MILDFSFDQVGLNATGYAVGALLGGAFGGWIGSKAGSSAASMLLTSFFGLGPDRALKECYSMLGVDRDSTQEQVSKAYRQKSRAYHPDKPQGTHDKMTKLNLCKEIVQLTIRRPRSKEL